MMQGPSCIVRPFCLQTALSPKTYLRAHLCELGHLLICAALLPLLNVPLGLFQLLLHLNQPLHTRSNPPPPQEPRAVKICIRVSACDTNIVKYAKTLHSSPDNWWDRGSGSR